MAAWCWECCCWSNLQFSRSTDSRHPRQADPGQPEPQRRTIGAIGGTAFAILYSVLGVPLALLADRIGKTRVIAGSLVVWSGFTALCGTAAGFWAALPLPPRRRGGGSGRRRPLLRADRRLFSDRAPRPRAGDLFDGHSHRPGFGAWLLGAYIAAAVNWQAAFFTVGIAGILVAPVFLAVVRDKPKPPPVAGSALATVGAADPCAQARLLAAVDQRRVQFDGGLWPCAVGAKDHCVPVRLDRSQPARDGRPIHGRAAAGRGSTGIFLGGVVSDRLGQIDRAWYARVPAIAWIIAAPMFILGFMTPNPVTSPG